MVDALRPNAELAADLQGLAGIDPLRDEGFSEEEKAPASGSSFKEFKGQGTAIENTSNITLSVKFNKSSARILKLPPHSYVRKLFNSVWVVTTPQTNEPSGVSTFRTYSTARPPQLAACCEVKAGDESCFINTGAKKVTAVNLSTQMDAFAVGLDAEGVRYTTVIKAHPDNPGRVWIGGNDGFTSEASGAYPLEPGEVLNVAVCDWSDIWFEAPDLASKIVCAVESKVQPHT